jgi:hypothetical protein
LHDYYSWRTFLMLGKLTMLVSRSALPSVIWFTVLVGASVFVGFAWGYPPHVARKIAFVIVDSVEDTSSRPLAHVGKKIDKFVPAPTDFDTASTVVFIADDIWIFTSADHHAPSSIERMKVSCSGVAVSRVADSTAAGTDFAFLEACGGCKFSVSAIALALPDDIAESISVRCWLKRNQFAEALTFGDRASPAPARGGVPTPKITKADNSQLAAIALAFPSRAASVQADTLKCRKSPKSFTSDIVKFGHDNLHERLLWQVARFGVGSASLAAHSSLTNSERLVA